MKIFVCCSKHFYHQLAPVITQLERNGHTITPPNSYDDPFKEEKMKVLGDKEHRAWKASMIRLQEEKVRANDAILVMNFEKNEMPNYIGGATFLEIFKAFELGRKVFLYNPIPHNIFSDELHAMDPCVIHGDLQKIR